MVPLTSLSSLRDEGYRQRHRLLVTSTLHTALGEVRRNRAEM